MYNCVAQSAFEFLFKGTLKYDFISVCFYLFKYLCMCMLTKHPKETYCIGKQVFAQFKYKILILLVFI